MSATNLDRIRHVLGGVGGFLGVTATGPDIATQRQALQRLEAAGWRAMWTNEIVGADALVRASLWLAATERMVVGTSIANVWARPAPTAAAAALELVQGYPDRFVLGVGVGRPEQAEQVGRDFGSPVGIARDYLRGLGDGDFPRLLAANGPKLLALAAELADGALPAGRPAEATAQARNTLGPDPLLVVYMPISGEGSAGAVAEGVAAHRDAGADHVIVGMSYDTEFATAVHRLSDLAADVAGL